MKKLMIILLVVMLSIGLSGVAFATGEQSVSAKITSTLTLTVPTALSDWTLSAIATATSGGDNTSKAAESQSTVGPHTASVVTNSPYTMSVVATAALPTYETTADTKMTTSYDGTEVDLATAFQLKYDSAGGSGANDTTSAIFSDLADVTITTAQTFVTATSPPADGTAFVGIEFGQTTVITDPAYDVGIGQLSYQIQLTWTASATL